MHNKKVLIATLATGLATTSAFVDASSPDTAPTQKTFEYKAHGLFIEKPSKGKHEVKSNGKVRQEETVKVRIKGHGMRKLTGVVEDEPIAAGGQQKTIITDVKDGTTMVFGYTPATNSISIADGAGESANRVQVTQNPDHQYTVDGVAAANAKEAVTLLREKPVYKGASLHSFMLAWAYAHAPTAATKNTQNCDLPTCCDTESSASPPAPCTIFQDFCTCVACDKVGGDSCSSCE